MTDHAEQPAGFSQGSQQCSYKGCQEPARHESPDGFCLYHAPQNAKDDHTARAVWQHALDKIERGELDFAGWHFPARPPGAPSFAVVGFPSRAVFTGATFRGNAADFSGSTFDGGADFSGSTFSGDAIFIGSTFNGRACLSGSVFNRDANFIGSTFNGGADFDGVVFEGRTYFRSRPSVGARSASPLATFGDWTVFNGATFRGEVGFADTVFDDCAFFRAVTFHGAVRMGGVLFKGIVVFTDAVFKADAMFAETAFEKRTTFHRAEFYGRAEFFGSSVADGCGFYVDIPHVRFRGFPPSLVRTPFRERGEGDSIYRLARTAATRRAEYDVAGAYHHAERCATESSNRRMYGWRPWCWRFWQCLLELVFGRLLFGYGERPTRVLITAVLVMLSFSVVYWGRYGIAPEGVDPPGLERYEPTRAECLYFSAVTFTTLGYGDMAPQPHCRLLASLEAATGVALTALFAVALARKYTR